MRALPQLHCIARHYAERRLHHRLLGARLHGNLVAERRKDDTLLRVLRPERQGHGIQRLRHQWYELLRWPLYILPGEHVRQPVPGVHPVTLLDRRMIQTRRKAGLFVARSPHRGSSARSAEKLCA